MVQLFRVAICLFFSIEALALAQTSYTILNTLDDGSVGSLRWAINAANAVDSGAVIINFDAATFSTARTITLTSGALPTITKSDVTITGPGASLVTISGKNAVQVFLINSGVTNIGMSDLTIANGRGVNGNGGCISNEGQLSLTGCVLSQCAADGFIASGNGGAIYNDGTLVVEQCTFLGNSATVEGGAIYSLEETSLTVSRSTFTANTGFGGSGGDAIRIQRISVVTISDSTFYSNGKSDHGNAAISGGGTTSIQRCTFFANYGTAGTAGGLYVFAGTTTIENSIIYGNLGNTGLDIGWVGGSVVDNGYNIIGTADFTPDSTTLRSDPLLVALADNGGSTMTCAVGSTSPAINAANPTLKNTPDQRGLPQVGQRDIGAFEVQSGSGGGDPSFVGFMGQRFGFNGKANKSFHIYSDPYITVNSLFAIANPSTGKGTVMYAFAIRWENHTVTFGVNSSIKNKTALLLSIDSIERFLPRSKQATQLDDCINATWSFPKLMVSTPLHKIGIDWRSEHNDHINGSYLNIRIDAPLDTPTLCGGVLGQTASAKNAAMLSQKDADFITSDDMISTEARTSKFSARPMLCAAMPTQPPSTAVAAHEHVAHGMRV